MSNAGVTEQVAGYNRKKKVRGLPQEIEEACAQRHKALREILNSQGDKQRAKKTMKFKMYSKDQHTRKSREKNGIKK